MNNSASLSKTCRAVAVAKVESMKPGSSSTTQANALHAASSLPSHSVAQMTALHLTASPCYGGPERQILGLGHELREWCRSVLVSFQEEGRCGDFVHAALRQGFEAHALQHDTPRLLAALCEILAMARRVNAAVLCCHGYKANLLGLFAARRLGIPIISLSHGWTGESLRVRVFEALDRRLLRRMDKVVCVSEGQAKKVRRAGVPDAKVQVIHDAVRAERFDAPDPAYRQKLLDMFPEPPTLVVGAAGRLSPEKGFDVLVDAAALVEQGAGGEGGPVGFVLFGDGPLRDALARQIAARGLERSFVLAGFHSDIDRYFPHFGLFVQSSHTEGLPNVVLEAQAAGVPVVATAVGGTAEIVQDGVNGLLLQPGDGHALAARITELLADWPRRRKMGDRGRQIVREKFSFMRQAQAYVELFEDIVPSFNPPFGAFRPALKPAGSEQQV